MYAGTLCRDIQKIRVHRRSTCKVTPRAEEMQAGVLAKNMNEINYAFMNLEVGGVIVNNVPTFRVDHMPYGSIKDSGLGREAQICHHGYDGAEDTRYRYAST